MFLGKSFMEQYSTPFQWKCTICRFLPGVRQKKNEKRIDVFAPRQYLIMKHGDLGKKYWQNFLQNRMKSMKIKQKRKPVHSSTFCWNRKTKNCRKSDHLAVQYYFLSLSLFDKITMRENGHFEKKVTKKHHVSRIYFPCSLHWQ